MSDSQLNLSPTECLEKAREGNGLLPEEVEVILENASPEDWNSIFGLAKELTESNFENRIQLFAPLYFSSCCVNDCSYCGFKRSNRLMKRTRLTRDDFLKEAEFLWQAGHRSLLLVAAEHPVLSGPLRIAKYLYLLAKEGYAFDVAIEVGPFEEAVYRELKDLDVSRVVLYQETYDRETYAKFHEAGPKQDYDYRYEAMGRALHAGIDNVGIGFLLGLYSWRKDFVNLLKHARQLEAEFGKLPATFSFPRLRAASGVLDFKHEDALVLDDTFEKIIALSRISMPRVGITLTTRETPQLRDRLLQKGIGVTHVSAGVSTAPGGYVLSEHSEDAGQFELSDNRSLLEVAGSVHAMGYEPLCGVNKKEVLRMSLKKR